MYEKVFNLNNRPFISAPDPSRFFSATAIHDALSSACSSIERASGTVIVVGPTGSGKSLFLKMIEEQFSSIYKVVNLACARLTNRADLLQSIMFELGQPYTNMSEGELRLGLIDYLKPGEHCPNGILLLVDEAQTLPPMLLDEIRLLTNFVRDGRPRAQLVLAGGLELEEVLMDPSLDSFNQRIAARCYLENFSQEETGQFVRNAVVYAGGDPDKPIFTQDALYAIHKHTQGCPRQINQVCDYAMILASTTNCPEIDVDCIHEAWADVQSLPNQWGSAKSQAHAECKNNSASVPSPCSEPASTPKTREPAPTIAFDQPSSTQEANSTVEFGVLDSATPSEDVRPLSSFSETEMARPVEVDYDSSEQDLGDKWTVIEFDALLPEESEQLATAETYEDSGLEETVLEFGQLKEESEELSTQAPEPAVQEEKHEEKLVEEANHEEFKPFDTEVEKTEYQLAPIDVNVDQIKEIKRSGYESVSQSIAEQINAEQVDEAELVDTRFSDLAKFLAQPNLDDESNPTVEESSADRFETSESELHSLSSLQEDLASELEDDTGQWAVDIERDRELRHSLGLIQDEEENLQIEMKEPIEYRLETVEQSEFVKEDEELIEGTGWPDPIFDEDETGIAEQENAIPVSEETQSDPFAETFEEEEVVYDPYAELFARQNNDSLNISREQLNVLDSLLLEETDEKPVLDTGNDEVEIQNEQLESAADPTSETVESDSTDNLIMLDESNVENTEDEQPVAVADTEDEQPAAVDSTAEPVDENELLKSIQVQQEEIASQIFKLKRDFSEHDTEPEIETSNVDQDEPHHSEHEDLAEAYAFAPREFSNGDTEDDKDLLIIQPSERIDSAAHEDSYDPERAKKISKGRAIRMEYGELFKQLRAAE